MTPQNRESLIGFLVLLVGFAALIGVLGLVTRSMR
jgi:hypothetical protein